MGSAKSSLGQMLGQAAETRWVICAVVFGGLTCAESYSDTAVVEPSSFLVQVILSPVSKLRLSLHSSWYSRGAPVSVLRALCSQSNFPRWVLLGL